MTTRKEQLKAGEFARRRVLGALLRPGSGNADEAAPRPFRTFFLAVVALAFAVGIATVVGYLKPAPPADDWHKGLIKDSAGTPYVVIAGRLHQVANQTSARLILGPTAKTWTRADRDLVDLKRDQGPVVGLAGVPDPLPKPAELDLKDWSVCVTPAGQTVTEVGFPAGPGAFTGAAALLAQDDAGQEWVIEDGVRYQVQDRPAVLAVFHAQAVKPRRVPPAWLGGLAVGDPLAVPAIPGTFGAPIAHAAPAGFDKVGMFGRSLGSDGSPAYYVVEADGLVPVSATMYELYEHEPRLTVFKFTAQNLAPGAVTPAMLAASPEGLNWPADPPTFGAPAQNPKDPAAGVLCAAFDGSFDQQGHPHVVLSTAAGLPTPLPPAAGTVLVRAGHAALVRDSGTDAATATCYLLTDSGKRYQLVGTASAQLGYDAFACTEVPTDWLNLVPAGPALDPKLAAQPVTQAPAEAQTQAPTVVPPPSGPTATPPSPIQTVS